MILKFKKGTKENLPNTEFFFSTDFDCLCKRPECDKTLIDTALVKGLQELWKSMGGFLITSGFRCEEHNKEVGGAPLSQHLLGRASDLRSAKSYNGLLMAKFAEQVALFRLGGIGTYKQFPNIIHVDVGPKRRWAK